MKLPRSLFINVREAVAELESFLDGLLDFESRKIRYEEELLCKQWDIFMLREEKASLIEQLRTAKLRVSELEDQLDERKINNAR